MYIIITDEMKSIAAIESARREPYIKHHFKADVSHDTNQVGYLGEYACKQYFGLDWKKDVGKNYNKADNGDIFIDDIVIDVKTETVDYSTLHKIVMKHLTPTQPYGCRLITAKQIPLLHKYDFVIFGAIPRETLGGWYPLGFLDTTFILNHYKPSKTTPGGFELYSESLCIPQGDLRNPEELKAIINA